MKGSTSSVVGLIVFMAIFGSMACNQSSQPTVKISSPVTAVKHYQLKGKVVSIDQRGKMVNIDNEPIPGFMESMTMPYQVKPEGELEKLHPGDTISADLVVQDTNAWLENISTISTAPEGKK
ncbi:MAG TPA: copper-binding protein [Terriglobales bacterium]|nr:copper-binding protein [Terriglobales bacterium]